MHKVKTNKKINAAKEKVWEAFDDFGGIHRFHPLVESSPILNGIERGIGSERQCNFYGNGAIRERITDYQEGEKMEVEIIETGPFPINKAVAVLSVKSLGHNKTEVEAEIEFEPKYGPVGWLMAKLMMKSQFRRTFEQVLDGLETHVTTGKMVGRKGVLSEATAV